MGEEGLPVVPFVQDHGHSTSLGFRIGPLGYSTDVTRLDITVREPVPYSYSISDPGQDTVVSVATSCGTGGEKVAGSDTNMNASR
mgnify:CR=1 FL=1